MLIHRRLRAFFWVFQNEPTIYFVSNQRKIGSEAGEFLQSAIARNHARAAMEEKSFHESVYDVDLFIGLDFKHSIDKDRALDAVGHYIDYLSRVVFKRHLFAFGWFDIQPNRDKNNQGSVLHFHLFVDVEGGLPDEFAGVGLVGKANLELRLSPPWRNMRTGSSLGRVEVDFYDRLRGGIIYSAMGHEFYYEHIGCPRKKHQCRKPRHNQDCCVFRRDRQRFLGRHQFESTK